MSETNEEKIDYYDPQHPEGEGQTGGPYDAIGGDAPRPTIDYDGNVVEDEGTIPDEELANLLVFIGGEQGVAVVPLNEWLALEMGAGLFPNDFLSFVISNELHVTIIEPTHLRRGGDGLT